jgi:topoisomerase-like DNA binding C4 zinc finger protein
LYESALLALNRYETLGYCHQGQTPNARGTKFAANLGMANPQLDQFIYALIWKAGPIVILFGCGVVVLRELVRRIARRVTRFVRARGTDRSTLNTPHCPSCDRPMVKRTVRRGFRAGSEFWGCSNYPACSDTRSL